MKTVSTDELRNWLWSCLAVSRWVEDVLAQEPFATPADLLRAAREAATPLSRAEVTEALAVRARNVQPARDGAAEHSVSMGGARAVHAQDEALSVSLAEGSLLYLKKFGRVFLTRTQGRSPQEVLNELNRRLELSDAADASTVARELRDIALLQLAKHVARETE